MRLGRLFDGALELLKERVSKANRTVPDIAYLLPFRRVSFYWTDFVHRRHGGRAGVAADVLT